MKHETRNSKLEILFVCLGNTCRSPMAEGLFNKLSSEKGLSVTASSAGLGAFNGAHAAANAVSVMAQQGIDITKHRARLLDEEIIKAANLVLVMEGSQIEAIPEIYKEKVHLLSEYASGAAEDIFDPIGGGLDTYQNCANLIEKHLINLLKHLQS